jgi:hypothetical protein
MTMESHFKKVCESAGAVFLRVERGRVYFSSFVGEPELCLYAFACTEINVRLTLKAQAEELAVDRWQALV